MGKLRNTLGTRRLKREPWEQEIEALWKKLASGTGKAGKRASGTKRGASRTPSCAAFTPNPLSNPLTPADVPSTRKPLLSLQNIVNEAGILPGQHSASSATPIRSCLPATSAAFISHPLEQFRIPALPTSQSSQVTISEHEAGFAEAADADEEDLPLRRLVRLASFHSSASTQRRDSPVQLQPASASSPAPPDVKAPELSPVSLYLCRSPLLLSGLSWCLEASPESRQPGGQDDVKPKDPSHHPSAHQHSRHMCSPVPRGTHLPWASPCPDPSSSCDSPTDTGLSGAQAAGEHKGPQLVSDCSTPSEQPSQDCFVIPSDLQWLTLPECKAANHV